MLKLPYSNNRIPPITPPPHPEHHALLQSNQLIIRLAVMDSASTQVLLKDYFRFWQKHKHKGASLSSFYSRQSGKTPSFDFLLIQQLGSDLRSPGVNGTGQPATRQREKKKTLLVFILLYTQWTGHVPSSLVLSLGLEQFLCQSLAWYQGLGPKLQAIIRTFSIRQLTAYCTI